MKNIRVPLKDKIEQKLVWLSPELRGCRSIRKWKCGYLKKAYQISPGEEYAERLLMTAEEGNERILSLISNGGGIV